MTQALLEVRDLYKIFGTKSAEALKMVQSGQSNDKIREITGANVGVNKANFSIQQGELFVIMGLSGSGKSTLLRCLNRLIEPTSGEVLVNGENILKLKRKSLLTLRQQRMSMVFQQFALLPHRTILDNVAFGLELQGMPKEQRLDIATQQLDAVGLSGWGQEYPENLSGGMQQRVGLARALANQSDILLMDEAFSALDPLIRDDMQNELLQLQTQLKKTIVFITHDLNEALKLGDRIALMKDGEIVQQGTPDEIISAPANEYVARFVRGVDLTKVLVAEDVMRRPQPLIRANEGPRVALRKLRDAGLSSGFVVNDSGQLQGVMTADSLVKAIPQNVTQVREIELMEARPVSPDALLDTLLQEIIVTPYPLAVVDTKGLLKGIVSRSAILEALALQRREPEDAAETSAQPLD